MDEKTIPTQYASAERSTPGAIKKQLDFFMGKPLLKRVLDAVQTPLVILNKERQIVFANKLFVDFIGESDMMAVSGLRPGEAVGCVHAFKTKGGCGTTDFCSACGAVNAILFSQKGSEIVQECRITLKENGGSLDFRVMASPLKEEGEEFTVFTVTDIAHEKRRQALEHIFFHDILNTAGGLHGFSQLLVDANSEELRVYKKVIPKMSEKLIEEITTQQQLLKAENNELEVKPVSINSLQILFEIINMYSNHDIAKKRNLIINPEAEKLTFSSDPTLLSRVIGNMVKNALEASKEGDTVTINSEKSDGKIKFSVHNEGEMPKNAQLQVFQRSFSTKGAGRGLGTYSMKLLSEKYLKGKISFVSTKEGGTTFYGLYPINTDAG